MTIYEPLTELLYYLEVKILYIKNSIQVIVKLNTFVDVSKIYQDLWNIENVRYQ